MTGFPTVAVGLTVGAVGVPIGPVPWTAVPLPPAEVVALWLVTVSVVALVPLVGSPDVREVADRGRGRAGSVVAAAAIALLVGVPVWSVLAPAADPGLQPVFSGHAH